MSEQRLEQPRTVGDGIRDYDAVVIRQGQAYAAEWDAETEQAMPLTDEDGNYIPVTLEDEFVTPAEAARLTGTDESTWRYRLIDGKIRGAFKKGKQWLIPRSSVKAPMAITVWIDTDTASLFGPDPDAIEGVDEQASATELANRIEQALTERWPEAEIAVNLGMGPGGATCEADVGGAPDYALMGLVDQIHHDIWQEFDWVVYGA